MGFDLLSIKDCIVHLTGIGGVSMTSLALYLKDRGFLVRGSDRDESKNIGVLREQGIAVTIGHAPKNVQGAGIVVRSAAIGDDNPEIIGAREWGIPVYSRAEAWGAIMKTFDTALCIAGTHGKTTTTSMISIAAVEANLDPTIMLGGELTYIGGALRIGGNSLIIAESCEYMNSFLSFAPTIPVVLNIDRDHVDFFKSDADISAAFSRFAALAPSNGIVIYNIDDDNTRRSLNNLNKNALSFGESENAVVRAVNIHEENGFYTCEMLHKGEHYCSISLSIPGRHNLMNAAAAAACAVALGIPGESFEKSIHMYTGVGRRFESKGQFMGADVFDDYAHHPNEIKAAISTAADMTRGRVICAFQPHTFTRTQELMPEFAQALSHADAVVVCPIFAARESAIPGVDSQTLAAMIPGAYFAETFTAAKKYLAQRVMPGDILLTMGAGDIFKLADLITQEINA